MPDPEHRTLDEWLARVRQLLRRQILLRAAWLPGIQDGPTGRALVAFVMGQPDEGADNIADVQQLDWEPLDGYLPTEQGVAHRFATFRERLQLSPLECEALWLLLAPEFDARFLAAYRMIWGDAAQRYCDADFVATMLAPAGLSRLVGLLDEDSDILRLRLIEAFSVNKASSTYFRPARRLLGYLTGMDTPEARFSSLIELCPPVPPTAWLGFALQPAAQKTISENLTRRRVIALEASRRAGVDLLLQQIAGAERLPLVRLDLAATVDVDAGGDPAATRQSSLVQDDAALLRAALREARLAGAVLHLRGIETLVDLPSAACRLLGELLSHEPQPIFLECDGPVPANILMHVFPVVRAMVVPVATPTGAERRDMWSHVLRRDRRATAAVLDELASLPADPRTMEVSHNLSQEWGRPVLPVARHLVARTLPKLATRVEVSLSWDDVILRPEEKLQIEHIRTFGAHYDQVMKTWGLGRKSAGRGVKVLFSGPSGTGKTLTSGLLARDLHRDLYQVDVSAVLSKWVGETEKHLSQLFREARSAGAALLFDEADALFGRRSPSAESAGERFGSQVVAFLLQEIEVFEGIVILTTNLESAIDTAFARRLHYHVHFKAPDAEQRTQLWRIHLPKDVPLAATVDLEYFGEAYELTGGEIHKAAIRAAVNAIQSGSGQIGPDELEDAIVSQYVEKGRLPPSRRAAPQRPRARS